MIILPNGDTLQHVLRVRSLVKKLVEKMVPYVQKDSVVLPVVSIDSINYHLNNDSVYMQVETYRWYADGYRYPIFETVESITYKNQKTFKHFNTAFLYSPNKHSYLDRDSINAARLDNLQKVDEELMSNNTSAIKDHSSENNFDRDLISYNVYIDKENNNISIEYNLKKQAEVKMSLYDMQGRLLASYPKTSHPEGFYQEAITLGVYTLGEYLLQIIVNDIVYGEKIIKQ